MGNIKNQSGGGKKDSLRAETLSLINLHKKIFKKGQINMKKITKILSLLLAAVMALTMSISVTALADGEENYTITIKNETSGYVYSAYQIFDGDLSGSGTNSDPYILSNIVWGSGVDDESTVGSGDDAKTLIQAINAITISETTPFADCKDAAGVAEILATYTDDSELVQKFADVVSLYLSTTAATSSYSTEDSNYTITVTDPGYYLVKNTTVTSDGAYTRFILEVTGDAEVEPKSDVPSVTKKVYEEDYTGTDYGTGYNDVADYDIGDKVPFELIGSLPENLSDYETYKYIFHDTLSTGLTFNDDVVVKVVTGTTETTVASSNYSVKTDDDLTDDCSFEVQFTDILSLKDSDDNSISVTSSSKIYVYYTATLNSDAAIGLDGNTNKVTLEYSNNPNEGGSGDIGTTPEDIVIVFTYKLDVTKVDGEDNTVTLEGAEFVLYKTVTSTDGEGNETTTKYYVKVDSNNKVTGWTTDESEASTLTSDDSGNFSVTGLDDGTYYLEETKAPTGYNLLDDPIKLVIAAATDNGQSWSGKASDALTALTISVDDGEAENGNTDDGTVDLTVENNSGATLPSTGGMGTKIFYTLGGILVVCAGILLIVKRRMRNA